MAKVRVAIVGGGIGGLACALSLGGRKGKERASNVEVTVYEAAPKFEEIGAGVSFGLNAYNTLSKIGVLEDYLRVADPVEGVDEDTDRVWFEWSYGEKETYDRICMTKVNGRNVAGSGSGLTSVHRADFLNELVELLPESVDCKFGHRLASYSQASDDAPVEMTFVGGQTATCDVLLAFDGIKSAARATMYQLAEHTPVDPRFTGTVVYRAILDYDRCVETLGHHVGTVPQMILGPDTHVLTFIISKGKSVNVVAFRTDRSKPVGQREWTEGPWVRKCTLEEMLADFEDWKGPGRDILQLMGDPSLSLTKWALHEITDEMPRYVLGPVALAGDAAHALLPHCGSGAGQAIEDAYVLGQLLTDSRVTRANAQAVLRAYEKVRMPRAQNVQRISRHSGDVYEFASDEGDDRRKLAGYLESFMDEIWNHDIDDSVAAARAEWEKSV